MSNDVLKDGFFADKEISASEKLALCALSLGGTYSEQVTQDGRNTVLFSMVYKKSGDITPVAVTLGNPNSLSNMACEGLWVRLGLDKAVGPMDKTFAGEYSDVDAFSKMANSLKVDCNLSEAGLTGKFAEVRKNVNKYFELGKKYNNAFTPEKLNGALGALEEGFTGKKNELSSNSR